MDNTQNRFLSDSPNDVDRTFLVRDFDLYGHHPSKVIRGTPENEHNRAHRTEDVIAVQLVRSDNHWIFKFQVSECSSAWYWHSDLSCAVYTRRITDLLHLQVHILVPKASFACLQGYLLWWGFHYPMWYYLLDRDTSESDGGCSFLTAFPRYLQVDAVWQCQA